MKLHNKNKWKTATTILSIACIVMLAIIIEGDERDKEFTYQENKTPKELCANITGTPAWVASDGIQQNVIISYGYKGNTHPDGGNLVDFLIENKVYMLYNPGCGWCEKQIESFGSDWNRYVNGGLAINCAE